MNDETKMVELTDAELDAVAGGLNALGSMAQDLGGQVLGERIYNAVSNVGGQVAAETFVVPNAQTV